MKSARPVIAVLLAAISIGCAARSTTTVLPAPPPPGIVGMLNLDWKLTPTGFSIGGYNMGSGLMIDDNRLLITHHQSPFYDRPIPSELASSPGLLPMLLTLHPDRNSRFMTMHILGSGPVGARLVYDEDRVISLDQNFRGDADFGWTVVHIEPGLPGPRVRVDFDRPLEIGQEIYLLRPSEYHEPKEPHSRSTEARSRVDDLAPIFQNLRETFADVTSRPVRFDAWKGRICSIPTGPTSDIDFSSPWTNRVGFMYFGFEQDFGGASGGPVLIRDGDEWIAVGIYSTAINYDNLLLVRYQFGIFVRPDLSSISGRD